MHTLKFSFTPIWKWYSTQYTVTKLMRKKYLLLDDFHTCVLLFWNYVRHQNFHCKMLLAQWKFLNEFSPIFSEFVNLAVLTKLCDNSGWRRSVKNIKNPVGIRYMYVSASAGNRPKSGQWRLWLKRPGRI